MGLQHEKHDQLLQFLSMGILVKHCLKTAEIELAVHVNTVVVDEVEPCK